MSAREEAQLRDQVARAQLAEKVRRDARSGCRACWAMGELGSDDLCAKHERMPPEVLVNEFHEDTISVRARKLDRDVEEARRQLLEQRMRTRRSITRTPRKAA
ncbi:hypothetical protein GCM10010472_10930 [Pseudonocardia halophobica]|uniref:Uncharacterized protein n=2 Tax=Pseudonocardia halophobica TaxID=29401 RepID=A0A9W6NXH2_9PSEU|nr:hypothetical protein GCM10017577_46240 [Pseudonocardia halophobica]